MLTHPNDFIWDVYFTHLLLSTSSSCGFFCTQHYFRDSTFPHTRASGNYSTSLSSDAAHRMDIHAHNHNLCSRICNQTFMHVHVLKYDDRANLLLPSIMGGQYYNGSKWDYLKHVELWVMTWLSHFSACHTSLKIIEWLHTFMDSVYMQLCPRATW